MASSFWTSPLMLALGGIAVFITLGTVVITLGLAYLKKPSIRLEYVTENVDGSLVLTLNIYNDPIYLPLFTHLNIGRKRVEEFCILHTLWNEEGGKVCDLSSILHDRDDNHGFLFPLPASPYVGLRCAIARLKDTITEVIEAESEASVVLANGIYEWRVLVHPDETDVTTWKHHFYVDAEKRMLTWVGKPSRLRPVGNKIFVPECLRLD